jgi:hypothetical protein
VWGWIKELVHSEEETRDELLGRILDAADASDTATRYPRGSQPSVGVCSGRRGGGIFENQL